MAESNNKLNFTYLLGAGASANAHPTVAGLKKYLVNYEKKLTLPQLRVLNDYDQDKKQILSEFKWLSDQIDRFTSPDTLAKVAFLSNEHVKYKRIKDILTIFFYIEEISSLVKEPNYDSRYINFLASVFKSNYEFPENLKILSWNYDFQFELAAHLIKEDNGRDLPLIAYYPSTYNFNNYATLVHLNGCACVFNEIPHSKNLLHHQNSLSIIDFWRTLQEAPKNKFISFSWEGNRQETIISDHLINTDILVIIGYSFPFFNREADKKIFGLLRKEERLRKIYFQDPNLNGDFLFGQFNLPESDDEFGSDPSDSGVFIKHIDKVDSFFIPPEF